MDAARSVTIDLMGECAVLVTLGAGVSQVTNERVHALAYSLQQLQIPGVLDIVPAYSSVLITFNDATTHEEVITEHIRIAAAEQPAGNASPPRRHVIPVKYGGEHGPDLDAVAAMHGLSCDEVIRRHTLPPYRVFFLGFMPGFAYLGGLDRSIASPRLASPRVRVPAGSVGIAGDQTGIYPLSSPGGWQLIGRTDVALWELDRDPPALLAPRDEVLFVATEQLDPSSSRLDPQDVSHEPGSHPVFTVQEPGALSTLQDQGRPGHGHLGLSTGGAMDLDAVAAANSLVGNPPAAACLEITWSGPTLTVLATTVVAIAGADLGCRVEGRPVLCGISWLVRAGSELRFAGAQVANPGARCYLSVAGGFSAIPVLGSRSTYLPGNFGGYHGRQVQAGDTLYANHHRSSPAELAGRVGKTLSVSMSESAVLRYVPYLGQGSASPEVRRRADSLLYEVSPASDRMGIRLLPQEEGALAARGEELTSFGVVRGAIQLPPGGTPVVLGADHQTTGGYPLLGVVARADWSRLAQLRPGDKVRLQPVTLEEARAVGSASHSKL